MVVTGVRNREKGFTSYIKAPMYGGVWQNFGTRDHRIGKGSNLRVKDVFRLAVWCEELKATIGLLNHGKKSKKMLLKTSKMTWKWLIMIQLNQNINF